jgi:hypothetical protein
MTVRLHFRAEVRDKRGKQVLVLRANGLYNKFIKYARNEAANRGTSEGTVTITAQEWAKGESKTFNL